MDTRLLLVNGITLLYRESQQINHSANSVDLARKIIDDVKAPEITMGREFIDHQMEIITGLKNTLHYMCSLPWNHVYEPAELLQRLKVNVGDDDSLYDALYNGIAPELSESALKRTIVNLQRQIRKYFREKEVSDIIAKAFTKVKYNRSKIFDMDDFVTQVVTELSAYQSDNTEADPAIVGEVDFSNGDDVTAVYKSVKEDDNGDWIMRTGFQGLNRCLDGGFRRGEEVVLGALQHNFKTGMSLTLFKQIALYNTPKMIDPNKKPLLLRISFEDSLKENFTFLYQSLYVNEHKKSIDASHLSEEEMGAYVMDRLTRTGYHIKMLRVNPSLWTYLDIQNLVLKYESEGYEVHMCMLDYLAMVPTTGCIQTTIGSDIRDMFRRLRNFFNPRMTLFFTPHQLSNDAKKLTREGRGDLVKVVNGKGYWDSCGRLDQEVDLELYMHIEFVNGKAYLTIQRGKHRKTKQTPIADRYFVLEMHEIGDVYDDVLGEDTTLKRPGGGRVGTKGEIPVFQFDEMSDFMQ